MRVIAALLALIALSISVGVLMSVRSVPSTEIGMGVTPVLAQTQLRGWTSIGNGTYIRETTSMNTRCIVVRAPESVGVACDFR
jgi:hypothetical protein